MKVLIVDDSVTFRSAIKAALADASDIEVTGTAANGRIALAKLENDPFDLMILDLEMPDMDGIETLEAMRMRGLGTLTLIFASPTEENYKKVAAALRLGAADFLAKPTGSTNPGDIDAAIESIKSEIIPKIRSLVVLPSTVRRPQMPPIETKGPKDTWTRKSLGGFSPAAIVIASSTGGPMALERVFSGITTPIRTPIFLVQHMPPPFTKGLAKRIGELTGVLCEEGVDGEVITNRIYVAPADFHMSLRRTDGAPMISITQGSRVNFVRPAADPLFSTSAAIYGSNLMAFVLTGMGEDGKAGACDVKRAGGGVMIQDEATSVVWGMPGSVFQVGAFDQMGSIEECAITLRRMVAA